MSLCAACMQKLIWLLGLWAALDHIQSQWDGRKRPSGEHPLPGHVGVFVKCLPFLSGELSTGSKPEAVPEATGFAKG